MSGGRDGKGTKQESDEARRWARWPSPGLIALALALAAVAAAAEGAASNESAAFEDALFDAAGFESEAGSSAAGAAEPAGAEARTSYLAGGAFSVSARAVLDPELAGYAVSSSASGKVFAKVSVPDRGALFASFALSQAFFSGLWGEGNPRAAPAADLGSPSIGLSEFHYSFDLGKRLFVRLGKQLSSWGPARIWSPVDFPAAGGEDFFAPVDTRVGSSGLRLHLPMGSYNAFLFADLSGSVSGGEVLDPLKTTVLSARLDGTVGGFELGLSGRVSGSASEAAGLDFSGRLWGTTAYGELAWLPGEEALAASLGFSRALGDLKKWTLSGEGYYDSRGSDLSGDAAAMAAASSLRMGRYYAYLALEGEDFPAADAKTGVSVLANLSDGSYLARLTESLSLRGMPPLALSLSYYGGGEGREFTSAFGDGAWSLAAQTRIEF